MDQAKDPTGAERQKRWRDRRRAAGLPLRPRTEQPTAGNLRDFLLVYFAAEAAAPEGGDCYSGKTPEQVADKAFDELETALRSFVHSWGFDGGFDGHADDPATEAARLRLMAHLSRIMPIPTREEMRRRDKEALAAKKAEERARKAARQKERRQAQGPSSVPLRP